ncbi:PRKR-interacting protein 1 homolog [Haematobia irritans]|uniref:PRKR-interacting protein 1 homolog n=1 Tax=Haematobia irritans TaxID=7368 RepID=UPI003F503B39
MSLIKNLVKEPEKKDSEDKSGEKPRPIVKSAIDLQRLKLEKLMKNPEKPIIIPDQRKEKDYMQSVPSFVRNVMGSSAGAGSGEFHVYRHLRRKEYARQKMIQNKSVQEQLDEEYQLKLEENRRQAEEKTAKKRAKRLKKKLKAKQPKQRKLSEEIKEVNNDDESSSECEDEIISTTSKTDSTDIVPDLNQQVESPKESDTTESNNTDNTKEEDVKSD